MKTHLLALWAFVAALALMGTNSVATTDLPTQSALAAHFVWRGPWLIPYVANLIASHHARKRGSKEKHIGLQFVTSLLTLLFAVILTGLLAAINTLLNQPSDVVAGAVVMTVGLWEGLIKGLFFSVVTVLIWEKVGKRTN